MRIIHGTTKAQTIFLRAFRTDPFGPGVEKWPTPAILRRWLRRPGFVQAMRSIRDALRYQADFQLLSASASAAHVMHTTVMAGDHELQAAQLNAMSGLLKLAHLRQRFAPQESPVPIRISAIEELLATAHPNARLGSVLEMHQRYTGRDLRTEIRARMQAQRDAGTAPQRLVERPIEGLFDGDEGEEVVVAVDPELESFNDDRGDDEHDTR